MLTESLNQLLSDIQNQAVDVHVAEHGFCQVAESIGVVFWMTELASGRVIYVSPGYERIWGRTCAALCASPGEWFEAIHAEDRARVFDAALTRQASGAYDEEYRIVRPDSSIRWIRDRAFPVRNATGEVHRIAGMAEDITGRKQLEQEVIEMSDKEHCRLGQDLHDGICQQLVSIAFATDLLRRDLVVKSPPEAVRVARITALLDNAITQARNLSHSLCPVNLVGNGLGMALRELAVSISHAARVACEVDCGESVLIRNHAVATHLYRIAQDAVQSAVKYADASRVLISLHQEGEMIHLSVTDNGATVDKNGERNFGVELNMMKYRAAMAGGGLEVSSHGAGGTVITCNCPQKPA
jgi:PAS domain S-box-containing protein